jgi:hypothetical protein
LLESKRFAGGGGDAMVEINRGPVKVLLTAALSWLLAACNSGSSSSPTPDTGPGQDLGTDVGGDVGVEADASAGPPANPSAAAPPRFAFLQASDDLSKALADAYVAFVSTPTNSQQATAMRQKRAAALAKLALDPDGAATLLIDAFGAREQANPNDEEGLIALIHLLGDVESPTGLAFLRDYALRQPPAAVVGPEEVDRDPRRVTLLLRGLATDELGRRAIHGSQVAKGHLLDLAGRGSSDVQRIAVRNYYAASKLRWKAKQELREKLPPAQRHLLYEIY